MEPMKGKWASSRVDFGFTVVFCIPDVTSVYISSCDSVRGDSLVFRQENRGSIHVYLGNRDSSARNAGESCLISQRGACIMGFLEMRQEPGVYSRVTAGMDIRNSTLFSGSQDSSLVTMDS